MHGLGAVLVPFVRPEVGADRAFQIGNGLKVVAVGIESVGLDAQEPLARDRHLQDVDLAQLEGALNEAQVLLERRQDFAAIGAHLGRRGDDRGAVLLDAVAELGAERGLLGLAFHPDYANNGHFFVNYTNNSGTTIVARYTVSADPDIADASAIDGPSDILDTCGYGMGPGMAMGGPGPMGMAANPWSQFEDEYAAAEGGGIKELVAAEDPRRPMSDSQLTRRLQERGIDIARRTVSKYRERAGVPQARLRKRY